ncbi:hypothetical protein FB451DRAFT_1402616 [Mycena latifolia]|nr:hypothetical protein FB451DRAFT_1402616 [Mycena latifolia]
MYTVHKSVTAASSPSQGPGKKSRAFRPSKSKSDWLSNSFIVVKAVTAAAECIPFPYRNSVFGTAVSILETVEKVKKNRNV